MYSPSLKEFLKLSKSANVIPVYREIDADLDTPVSCYLKIKKDSYAFLLESVEGQEKIARYSFLGTKPSLIFRSKGKRIEKIYQADNLKEEFITAADPLDEIKKIMANFKPLGAGGIPRFFGGFVGFISYDAVRFFENIPDNNPDDLACACFLFILTDTILVFDHIKHTIKIISNVILSKDGGKIQENEAVKLYNSAIDKIEAMRKDLGAPIIAEDVSQKANSIGSGRIKSNYQKEEFEEIIRKAKTYIKRGDIIQVVLSQRFEVRIRKEPFDIYRSLRRINPSPYMFFLKLDDVTLIGSSPEMLVRYEDGLVYTRPIAGTRPRGKNAQEDNKLERELLNSVKEKAEHIMLVDLGRNDLGRVCRPGSVTISEFMSVEKYSHVMHLVTEVRGRLLEGKDIYDILRAAFPAGTVSGSPKIRAMEIIEELENSKRGPYAGCVGYFSFSGNMDTCITIRTILVKEGVAYVQAGAGIVADSLPEREYLETVNKARALVEAIIK